MSDSALDAVFKKMQTDVSDLEAKKNALLTELNTLEGRKDAISTEIESLQVQQREEEGKLGTFKDQTLVIEQESIKKIAAEREELDKKIEESKAALAELTATKQEISDREAMIDRVTSANAERGEALNRQAEDIAMREKQVSLDRTTLDERQSHIDSVSAKAEATMQDATVKLDAVAQEKAALDDLHEKVQKQAQEIEAQRVDVNNRQVAVEASEAKAKAATTKMEQFYALTREIAAKVTAGVAAQDQDAVEAALAKWYEEIGYTPAAASVQ